MTEIKNKITLGVVTYQNLRDKILQESLSAKVWTWEKKLTLSLCGYGELRTAEKHRKMR